MERTTYFSEFTDILYCHTRTVSEHLSMMRIIPSLDIKTHTFIHHYLILDNLCLPVGLQVSSWSAAVKGGEQKRPWDSSTLSSQMIIFPPQVPTANPRKIVCMLAPHSGLLARTSLIRLLYHPTRFPCLLLSNRLARHVKSAGTGASTAQHYHETRMAVLSLLV